MNTFDTLELIRKTKGSCVLSLIDPDSKNDSHLLQIIKKANNSIFDGILVGGSNISDNNFEERVKIIKNKSTRPIMLFPGSYKQITPLIDTILYLNLISGRNPKYLIEEHVDGAMLINKHNLHTVPTAYILLDGGSKTSVQKISKTIPLNMSDMDIVLSHALAGQYLGNKLIYFDCGSGSINNMNTALLRYISKKIKIPIMVGGGVNTKNDINLLIDSGASYVVVGNVLEDFSKQTLF